MVQSIPVIVTNDLPCDEPRIITCKEQHSINHILRLKYTLKKKKKMSRRFHILLIVAFFELLRHAMLRVRYPRSHRVDSHTKRCQLQRTALY